LLITLKGPFGITGMQTDDTLILCTPEFSAIEEKKIQKAAFRAKPKVQLAKSSSIEFNGARFTLDSDQLNLRQKEQVKKLQFVNMGTEERDQQYLEQRARGAYLAFICQPEAAFDLSVAAQAYNPDSEDLTRLNKRLQWQINHLDRGLRYINIDLRSAKLIIFADGSFANNRNLSSQLGFLIILTNEERTHNSFELIRNIIHWSSVKYKRVTRSILALKIYRIINDIDVGIALSTTLQIITTQLDLPKILIIILY
jgi:hypothetical protein